MFNIGLITTYSSTSKMLMYSPVQYSFFFSSFLQGHAINTFIEMADKLDVS